MVIKINAFMITLGVGSPQSLVSPGVEGIFRGLDVSRELVAALKYSLRFAGAFKS